MSEFEMVRALEDGEAFADLSSWRKVSVSGAEARRWLQDLVSADVEDLAPGRARRSLLLSPTGRIRAEFTVAAHGAALLLIQDSRQPQPVDRLLAPYVLSSDVTIQDRTGGLALFAFPGGGPDVETAGSTSAPSCLGAGGVDLIVPASERAEVSAELAGRFAQADEEQLEAWRVTAGIPRFGLDATDQDLPQEAGLGEAVAFHKGCYLGQEAVAKVHNLGHPRRLVLHLESVNPVSAGDPVCAEGTEVGRITSAAPRGSGSVALARIRWDAREGSLQTAAGVPLRQPSRPV